MEVVDDGSEDEMEVDAETAELHTDAYAKVQSMPTWQPTRRKGRGAKMFDFNYRTTIYSMFANGTPLSAIGRNIVRVVKATTSWLSPKEPSRRMLSRPGRPPQGAGEVGLSALPDRDAGAWAGLRGVPLAHAVVVE